MEHYDFYKEEKSKIKESLKKLDAQAPELAAILRKHTKSEDRPPSITKEGAPRSQQTQEESPKRDAWGAGAAMPTKDL